MLKMLKVPSELILSIFFHFSDTHIISSVGGYSPENIEYIYVKVLLYFNVLATLFL